MSRVKPSKNSFFFSNNLRYAFTLIEVLVVATIIGLLATGAIVSYRAISKQGRDSARKAHLEQIRSAIEQYRANNVNGSYPDALELSINCSSTGGITDTLNTYLSKIPIDPSCELYSYYYAPTAQDGGLCDSSSSTSPCLDYILASYLESSTSASDCTLSDECVQNCRYCLTPYGQQ